MTKVSYQLFLSDIIGPLLKVHVIGTGFLDAYWLQACGIDRPTGVCMVVTK